MKICGPCGVKFGTVIPIAATYHYGVCDWCYNEDAVTEPRDYGVKVYNEESYQEMDGRAAVLRGHS